MPFFPTGTMERVDTEGQIATAMTLSRILSHTPFTGNGPVKLVLFDVHTLQQRFYFHDGIIPCLLSGMPSFQRLLNKNHSGEAISIAFPDDGAKKRFGQMFASTFPLVICNKVREGDNRILQVSEGDPAGRHVFIVDDLVQSGGTLIACKNVLLQRGAAKVSAYVTHGVFPNESWKKFTDGSWTKFYVSDSVPDTIKAIEGVAPFEVCPLAAELHEFMLHISVLS
eukprot:NODE_2137_length_979_cov_59.583871_g1752_i0.p1 GENE.NODE_2137_length_979_cov_59.583871_g1752_i0~~NODE_2137_length_979_cov_59.583871_g1752_i0.p1  ORF type:complete len:225 (-),score=64.51 NODE_2137_length_979_cov_59.583871_g1752_i0:123-797(-)